MENKKFLVTHFYHVSISHEIEALDEEAALAHGKLLIGEGEVELQYSDTDVELIEE